MAKQNNLNNSTTYMLEHVSPSLAATSTMTAEQYVELYGYEFARVLAPEHLKNSIESLKENVEYLTEGPGRVHTETLHGFKGSRGTPTFLGGNDGNNQVGFVQNGGAYYTDPSDDIDPQGITTNVDESRNEKVGKVYGHKQKFVSVPGPKSKREKEQEQQQNYYQSPRPGR